ncbi:membrane protein PB1A10.07C, putative [Entamoeba invadens IP1]|uniref:Membrane protein PB1A10.07C, putative n=1 Tax=Entamoeba invadens IP1 TaxID=370355 RepID=A0A0A1U2T9_ENTIV|nr:membrane protein PB1A10.07C, putative [Entamoeba invadens IP1]ELP88344.1 membrane protein PB1A10.07C, putative [Entamoeba invadens IP1]|eukprot:XP_004255115.1 membrane protein PB1A10.07C, putative [Entamoeba invadens IP1]
MPCLSCKNFNLLAIRNKVIELLKKVTQISGVKAMYILLFFGYSLIVYIFSDFISKMRIASWSMGNSISNYIFFCATSSDDETFAECFSQVILSRCMEAYFCFHMILFAISFFIQNESPRSPFVLFHDGYWFFKIVLVTLLSTMTFLLPTWVHTVFNYLAAAGAVLFYLYTLISFLNFAAIFNVKMVNKVNTKRCLDPYVVLLLGSSVLAFSLMFILSIFTFVKFTSISTGKGTCKSKVYNGLFTALNMVISIISTIISMLPRVREYKPTSGIFQSSVVAAYTSYLLFTAITSQPCSELNGCWEVTDCADNSSLMSNYDWMSFLGIFFTVAVVAYQAYRNSNEISETSIIDDHLPDQADTLTGKIQKRYVYWKFHMAMCVATLFMLQNLSDWSVFKYNPPRVETGKYAFFVKGTVCFLCHILYIWTLVAPIIFPKRNFSNI